MINISSSVKQLLVYIPINLSNMVLWSNLLSNTLSVYIFLYFQIKDLDCMTKFIALGSLNLANNELNWHQVGKLRHMHLLELSLHGNKQLEKDPYCEYTIQFVLIMRKIFNVAKCIISGLKTSNTCETL